MDVDRGSLYMDAKTGVCTALPDKSIFFGDYAFSVDASGMSVRVFRGSCAAWDLSTAVYFRQVRSIQTGLPVTTKPLFQKGANPVLMDSYNGAYLVAHSDRHVLVRCIDDLTPLPPSFPSPQPDCGCLCASVCLQMSC